MQNFNPANESPIDTPAFFTPAELAQRVEQAKSAFAIWRKASLSERAIPMKRLAELLIERKSQLASIMTMEMGKPIVAAEAELEKCSLACDFFADNAARFLSQKPAATEASKSYVRFEPLGGILAIMPWNFPFWQVVRFMAPSLMAGNVCLLKHAPNVPQCALAIERICLEAGFPAGVFSSLLVDVTAVPDLLADPFVAAVTLTGSNRAGRAVATEAGKLLRKSVLELGGSDAFIVLADAEVPAVAQIAAQARCINNGQSCIAAKRFIVETPVYDAFVRALADAMSKLKVGDPMERSTEIGPLARLDLLENLHRQVEQTVAAGARLLIGGKRLDRPGFFYPPTVLADVKLGMAAFDEETFGPVAAVMKADHVDHAIKLANASPYGLGCSLWTQNASLAEKFVPEIAAGSVFINETVKSDPRLPFGGIKQSGYGRELSEFGIHEFVNVKSVWIK